MGNGLLNLCRSSKERLLLSVIDKFNEGMTTSFAENLFII
jgi:hypothetical protein